MSESKQEEIIATLWLIAALLAFGNGYTFLGWALTVKAGLDTAAAIYIGVAEVLAEKRAKVPNAKVTGWPTTDATEEKEHE